MVQKAAGLLGLLFGCMGMAVAQSCACSNYGPELLVNGDFSAGNTGFFSGYAYSNTSEPGHYGIVTDATLPNEDWAPCKGNTTGTDLFLWCDLSRTPGDILWNQQLPSVKPYTNYLFSCWVTNLNDARAAELQYSINGVPLGIPFTSKNPACVWQKCCFVWNSGNSTTADILIFSNAIDPFGNDVGLDDLSFRECVVTDTLYSHKVFNECLTNSKVIQLEDTRSYLWENNSTGARRTIDADGTYYVSYVATPGVYHVDTFSIQFDPKPLLQAPPPCVRPEAAEVRLTPLNGDTTLWTYHWFDTDADPVRVATSRSGDTLRDLHSGNYGVQVRSRAGCSNMQYFTLTVKPGIDNWLPDDSICLGETVAFAPTYTEQVISSWWDAGSGVFRQDMVTSFMPTTTGEYRFRHFITGPGGCRSDTLARVISVGKAPVLQTAPGTVIRTGETVWLSAAVDDPSYAISWQPAAQVASPHSLQTLATPTLSQVFEVQATGLYGCVASDTVMITVIKRVQVPNAFSPNGDGINDQWIISGVEAYAGAEVEVINRWGQRVFQSKGYGKPWDGTLQGKPLPAGVYYYLIHLPFHNEPVLRGSITLIR